MSRTPISLIMVAFALHLTAAFNPSASTSVMHEPALTYLQRGCVSPWAIRMRAGHEHVKTIDFVTVDLEGLDWLHKGEAPPAAAVSNVARAILAEDAAGVFKLRGHGVSLARLERLRSEARHFFDRPAALKHQSAVARMALSRGWEIYPHHYKHHLRAMNGTKELDYDSHTEPSAVESILCERFVCGPPAVCSAQREWADFYDSDFGQSFFHPNLWPEDDQGALRSAMEPVYDQFFLAAKGAMQCVAVALGVEHTAFDELISDKSIIHPEAPVRHGSRLQLNNYPSQLYRLGPRSSTPLRANQHLDTALLTLLHRQAGDAHTSGGLEVRLKDGSWARVPASTEELTVFLGSLSAILTGFVLSGTTHRVTNPLKAVAADSRRLSIGFNLRPDYSAPAAPPPALLRNATVAEDVPCIGLVGRIGWQRQAMAKEGITHTEAVAAFKPWKIATLGNLRDNMRHKEPVMSGALTQAPGTLPMAAVRSLNTEGYAVVEGFLAPELVSSIVSDVAALRSGGLFRAAKVGQESTNRMDESIRRNEQCFLSPWGKLPESVGNAQVRRSLYGAIDSLGDALQQGCGQPLERLLTEALYAFYPQGGYYRRHMDAVAGSSSVLRAFSYLIYLNEAWSPEDGGHLRIHTDGAGTERPAGVAPSFVDVEPRAGTLVVFRSDTVPHEVLDTNSQRLAIAGWFNRPVFGSNPRRQAIAALAGVLSVGLVLKARDGDSLK